jgi:hypothetical protein
MWEIAFPEKTQGPSTHRTLLVMTCSLKLDIANALETPEVWITESGSQSGVKMRSK